MSKHKKKIKWAGIFTGLGAIITGAVVPLVQVIKSDEKELHQDEDIINKLNGRIIDQGHLTHQIIDDVRKTLTQIYKDIGDINGKVSGVESAINILIRQGGHTHD